MFLKILNDDEVKTCLKGITQKTFVSGSNTQPDKLIKQNKESSNVSDKVRRLITDKLYDNHYCDSVYCPTRVSVNFYNEYKEGDFYNLHVDEFKARPKSKNIYFDYGWSLNLSDEYEGGEFVLTLENSEKVGKKLCAGEIVIFPIIYLHEVLPVTSGVRKNIVGWFSSNITYEQTYILRNLYAVSSYCSTNFSGSQHISVQANLVQNYLKKIWGQSP
jgi:predicted 2-oxoglutarate/Fe(II)-dependent dioxygenase YbiX